MLKIYNCNADGSPTYTPRNWWDAWMLLAEIAMCLGMAIFLLIADIIYIEDRQDRIDITSDLKERLYMALDTVPMYLRLVKRRK